MGRRAYTVLLKELLMRQIENEESMLYAVCAEGKMAKYRSKKYVECIR